MSHDQTSLGFSASKLGLLIDRMTQLLAAFADFAVLVEQAVHGAD